MAETFVDPRYFRGTCYRAAGWSALGQTRGYGKAHGTYHAHGNPKSVLVRELGRQGRRRLLDLAPLQQPMPEVSLMTITDKRLDELWVRLNGIPEHRCRRGIRHGKISILAVALCALVSNAQSIGAFLNNHGIMPTHVRVSEKTNEIPMVKVLLDPLNLKGKVVTLDALHTRTDTASYITEHKKADFVMTVKDNQNALREDIEALGLSAVFPQHRTQEKSHGRSDIREIWTSTEINDFVNFPHVAQVWTMRRHSTNVRSGKTRTETVHGITSLTPERADPGRLSGLVRWHWGIENEGHWVRDTTFGEDLSTGRKGNAPQVLATLRSAVVALLTLDRQPPLK